MQSKDRKNLSKENRMEGYKSTGGRCAYCVIKRQYEEMQIDHVDALHRHEKEYKQGEAEYLDALENLLPACRMCNFYKSTFTLEGFRKRIQTLKERLEKVFIYRIAKRYGLIEEKEKETIFFFEQEGAKNARNGLHDETNSTVLQPREKGNESESEQGKT